MERINLLVVDSSDQFTDTLIRSLQEHFNIKHCLSGKDALEQLLHVPPDVLVLDLMLPELDGITLLHKAHQACIYPRVLAFTRLYNEYVRDSMVELNVDYIMMKPCEPDAAAERVKDLCSRTHASQQLFVDPKTFVKELLLQLNVPSHLHGSQYLLTAICIMAEQPNIPITKVLYPTVAGIHGVTAIQVERAIRTAIQLAWTHQAADVWSAFFQSEPDDTIPRPSNGIFIGKLAEHCRLLPGIRQCSSPSDSGALRHLPQDAGKISDFLKKPFDKLENNLYNT